MKILVGSKVKLFVDFRQTVSTLGFLNCLFWKYIAWFQNDQFRYFKTMEANETKKLQQVKI